MKDIIPERSLNKRVLVALCHYTVLTFLHELGHVIGLLLSGFIWEGINVPFWLSFLVPLEFVYKANPFPGVWHWGSRMIYYRIPSPLEILSIYLIIPIFLELIYGKKQSINYQYLIPVIAYGHLLDSFSVITKLIEWMEYYY